MNLVVNGNKWWNTNLKKKLILILVKVDFCEFLVLNSLNINPGLDYLQQKQTVPRAQKNREQKVKPEKVKFASVRKVLEI